MKLWSLKTKNICFQTHYTAACSPHCSPPFRPASVERMREWCSPSIVFTSKQIQIRFDMQGGGKDQDGDVLPSRLSGCGHECENAGALPHAYNTKRRFAAHKIDVDEATCKLRRDKKEAKDPLAKVNDTLKINLGTNEIEEFCKFEIGKTRQDVITHTKTREPFRTLYATMGRFFAANKILEKTNRTTKHQESPQIRNFATLFATLCTTFGSAQSSSPVVSVQLFLLEKNFQTHLLRMFHRHPAIVTFLWFHLETLLFRVFHYIPTLLFSLFTGLVHPFLPEFFNLSFISLSLQMGTLAASLLLQSHDLPSYPPSAPPLILLPERTRWLQRRMAWDLETKSAVQGRKLTDGRTRKTVADWRKTTKKCV